MPAMQVATAMRKVVVPSVEWMGTIEALQEAVAEEQQKLQLSLAAVHFFVATSRWPALRRYLRNS